METDLGVYAKFCLRIADEALSASEKTTGPAPTPAEKEEPDIAHGGTRCNCFSCQEDGPHKSDCAVHDGPAMPDGPCNCGLLKKEDAPGEGLIGKAIENALRDYHCQHTEDLANGEGLPLVDMLCPPKSQDISKGQAEMNYLADHIFGYIQDALRSGGKGDGG